MHLIDLADSSAAICWHYDNNLQRHADTACGTSQGDAQDDTHLVLAARTA